MTKPRQRGTDPQEARHICPTPRNKAHPNEAQAVNAMRSEWAHPRPGRKPCRVYECPCGMWHTTKHPTPPPGAAA
jgi:hypothetical protein